MNYQEDVQKWLEGAPEVFPARAPIAEHSSPTSSPILIEKRFSKATLILSLKHATDYTC